MADAKVNFVFPGADATRQVTWPCTINVPADGGTVRPFLVDVRFNMLTRDQCDKVWSDAVADNKRGDLALYDAIVDGFPTFKDKNDALVGDVAAKAFFRSQDYYVIGIHQGFGAMRAGRVAGN